MQNVNTSSEVGVLEKTGAFHKAVGATPKTVLYQGDILVTGTKGHTVIVTEGSKRSQKPDKTDKSKKKSVEEVTKEVIAGK